MLRMKNNEGDTALHEAVRSNYIATKILETCKSASHEGTNGKTALHAAVLSEDLDIVKEILEKKRSLTKETDQNGWIPLHYAAYYGHVSIVQQLLEFDRSSAYKEEKQRNMTALHMAPSQGYENIMEAIISCGPDCCEMVDDRPCVV
ncbi:hypothetical protein Patl1_10448 [Pistacia atlantica]|uniref:Uncharacterized protein n=1 Tax=Pistacia atlantica TaxID=434234 RepID=A0ACC1A0F2_9ROSI|nr:hypothetical protein Patl1_10448 [Pistacia atlantica]